MVEAEEVEDRCLKVVHVNGVARHPKAQFIRRAVDVPRLHTTPRHPDREAIGIVITAEVFAGSGATLAEGRASKLAHAEHERVFE